MRKFCVILLLLCGILTSCTSEGTAEDKDRFVGEETREEVKPAEKPPLIADYVKKDSTYTVTLENNDRCVTLQAVREGEVTTAKVTYPENLSGLKLIYDAAGLRLRPPYPSDCEIAVSSDGAAGLCVIFDVLKTSLEENEYAGAGWFETKVSGYDVSVKLSGYGYPAEAKIALGDTARQVKYTIELPRR